MQWNYTHKAGWSYRSLLLQDRSFCGIYFTLDYELHALQFSSTLNPVSVVGILLPNVPGIGPSWFLAWAHIFACKLMNTFLNILGAVIFLSVCLHGR